jgi:hypothetical protein
MMNGLYRFSILVLILFFISCSSKQPASDQTADDASISIVADSGSVAPDTFNSKIKKDNVKSGSAEKADTITTNKNSDTGKITYIGEQAIIYRTKKDYSKLIPVTLNADKTKIISYPSPGDIIYQGRKAIPVKLKDGYWLDNRGINAHTAFLKITYDDYSKLASAPSLNDMMDMIEDKDPILEIYSLGTRARFKDEKKEMNGIIERGELKKFKKLK